MMSDPRGSETAESKRYLLWLVIAVIAVCALWFPYASSGNIRLDSHRMIFHADEAMDQYIREGRYGIVVLMRLLGLDRWQPVTGGILFSLFFALSGLILTAFLRRVGKIHPVPALLFFGLYSTAPVWGTHVYFTLQIPLIAFCLPFLALIGCTDACLINNRKWPVALRILYELLAMAAVAFSLSVYQALGTYVVACSAMLLFCTALQEKKPCIRNILIWIGRMILSLLLYAVVTRIVSGQLSTYLTGLIGWKNEPFLSCVLGILQEFGKILLCYQSAHFSLYPLSLILLIVLLLRRRKSGGRLWLWLTGAALALLPMAMSIVQGARIVPRAHFALQITAAAVPAIFLDLSKNRKKLFRAGCSVLCVIALLLQPLLVIRQLHTDNLRNTKDLEVAYAIDEQIADMDYTDKSIVFVGTVRQEYPFPLTERANVIGQSFFDWSWEEGNPTSATIGAIELLRAVNDRIPYRPLTDPDQTAQAVLLSEEMPAWPDPGFIMETDDFILINLPDR